MCKMRVLVAFEEDYRIYQSTIAGVIEAMRPGVEVAVAELRYLEAKATTFNPHLIITSVPRIANPIGPHAWVQLSPYPGRRSRSWIGEWYRESLNLSLD